MAEETEVVRNRLSKTAYDALNKEVRIIPNVPKTELEASFACGVEFVMRKLREGFVVGVEE